MELDGPKTASASQQQQQQQQQPQEKKEEDLSLVVEDNKNKHDNEVVEKEAEKAETKTESSTISSSTQNNKNGVIEAKSGVTTEEEQEINNKSTNDERLDEKEEEKVTTEPNPKDDATDTEAGSVVINPEHQETNKKDRNGDGLRKEDDNSKPNIEDEAGKLLSVEDQDTDKKDTNEDGLGGEEEENVGTDTNVEAKKVLDLGLMDNDTKNNEKNGVGEKSDVQEDKKDSLSSSAVSLNRNIENDTVVASGNRAEDESVVIKDQELKIETNENDPTVIHIEQDQKPSEQTTRCDSVPTTNEGKAKEQENRKEKVEAQEVKSPSGRIRVGICAMDKKAKSKPMAEILSRLDKNIFEIVQFGDDMILNMEVEEWPMCDVLIAFYSSRYPLDKAERYAELHPDIFILNDLKMQRVLMDRRRVYDLLEGSGIDVPRHVFMNRDGYVSTSDLLSNSSENVLSDTASIVSNHVSESMCNLDLDGLEEESGHDDEDQLIEHDDYIEVNGVKIYKPFVEKPVDADDHNIAIYYPYSAGGGCKKLFRKIGDRSSEFYPHINEVRRDGSYIYEEYVETQGIDVKMYTVGPDYGHAEARKSPTVDGKVERNADGKEVRFPVILTLREKEIARRIVMVFKQQVCGFDLLRVQEGDSLVSYVCDVNGWSFVKKSKKYYDDCAQILTEHMLAARKPGSILGFSALNPLLTKVRDLIVDTPKRRKNIKTFSRSKNMSPDKHSNQNSDPSIETEAYTLAEGAKHVRNMPDMLMDDPASPILSQNNGNEKNSFDEYSNQNSERGFSLDSNSGLLKQPSLTHQEELRCVITVIRHGDRTPKQKLKVKMTEPELLKYFHDHADNYKKELKVKDKIPMTEFLKTVKETYEKKEAMRKVHGGRRDDTLNQLLHMRDILERWKIGGLNRKLQMKPKKWDEFINEKGVKVIKCKQLQLILKWGGNLTKLGEKQAINLGKRLRHEIYPDEAGGGILRLHSTFRHDLKIKTSDEGRVMKTAAAFAKGLLELEGEIPPILVSLVHKEKNSHHMLDPSGNTEVKKEQEACKVHVNKQLQQDFDYDKASPKMIENVVGPSILTSLHTALESVDNPRKTLFAIREMIGTLLDQLDEMLGRITSDMENKIEGGEGLQCDEEIDEALSGIKLYKGETLRELTERWRLLYIKLYDEDDDEFDLSRVPDVHDNVRFDMLHNPHLGLTLTLEKLYTLAKLMADCVVPQEYGQTIEQKTSIGNKMCAALLEKLLYDLVIARTDNQVDMRYMINLQYSADLPINTMGRRIRTRLYFTSESHLHTLLNVLRFASTDSSSKAKNPLSQEGVEIISNASELCYLTQIVIRLFENASKKYDDPKRFRVEIFFSPGATATPLHVGELLRDADESRFETEPLQLISKPYLTSEELEEYFKEAIEEGKIDEDDDCNATSSAITNIKSAETVQEKIKDELPVLPTLACVNQAEKNEETENGKGTERIKYVTISEEKNTHISFIDDSAHSTLGDEHPSDEKIENSPMNGTCSDDLTNKETEKSVRCDVNFGKRAINLDDVDKNGDDEDDIDKRVKEMAIVLARQYFWTGVAAVSFVLGIGCMILSREVQSDFKTRRWTRR